MSDDDIRRLRELLAKATPGPWRHSGLDVFDEDKQIYALVESDEHRLLVMVETDTRAIAVDSWGKAEGKGRWDAELIAAAVNALPGLLDEVERLRAREADRD